MDEGGKEAEMFFKRPKKTILFYLYHNGDGEDKSHILGLDHIAYIFVKQSPLYCVGVKMFSVGIPVEMG